MDYPYVYYSDYDRSYEEVTNPKIGDIVCYYGYDDQNVFGNLHSGIITGYTGQNSNGTVGNLNKYTVRSKWGCWGLYEHRGDICPYMDDTIKVRYYRPRTNGSYNLSDDMSMASASATLDCDGSITDKYVMYELNVSDRMDYLISVQCNTPCNVKFYDVNMNYFSVSGYQYTATTDTYLYTLPYGVSYLRIQNLSATTDSDITIMVVPHENHDFVYHDDNASTHTQRCKCGEVGTTESHIWGACDLDDYTQCKKCGYLKRLNGGFIPIIKSKKADIKEVFAYAEA